MKKVFIVAGLLTLSTIASAERDWSGEGDFAFNKSTGNTRSEALLAKLKIAYGRDKWLHSGQIEAVNSSENDNRSAEYYGIRAKSDYAFSETYYGFGIGRYEANRFGGYEYQATVTVGAGAHIINNEVTQFDVEAGLGYRRSEEQGAGEVFNEAIFIAAAKYYRQLTATTSFESDWSVESGSDNVYAESVLALKVKINDHLALKVGYTVKHNTDVPNGSKNTDTFSSIGLNYSF